MKVLQINSVCGVGSTGRIAVDIYKVLQKQGHDCVIAFGRGDSPKAIKTIKIGNELSVKLHGLKSRLLDRHGFSSNKATKELITKIKEYNPDIIHLHNIHGYYLNIEILFNYLKEANKPVVWTLHDCWSYTGHCAYYDFVGCPKWKVGCHHCPQIHEYPASLFVDHSNSNYHKKKKIFNSLNNLTLITPSKWLAGDVKESFLKKYHVEVINNGIDLELFKPTVSDFRKEYDIENKFMVLGVASIWEARKGLPVFLELSKMLDEKYQIVLVGLNEKQLRELPKNVIGISRTNNVKELVEIYSSADVFVNPTYEDNFPTTNLEALACGTPVITFNTGGSVESITELNGVVIEKNINLLKEKIEELKLNNLNSEDCRNSALRYDKNDKFNEYINIYKRLMK